MVLSSGRRRTGRAPRRASGRHGGGFTVLDLLMTAVVLVLVAGVSVPLLAPRYRAYQVRAAAWQVAGDLRLARQRAVTTRNPYRFVFVDALAHVDHDTYAIHSGVTQGGVQVWVQEMPPAPGTRKGLGGSIHIDAKSTPRSRAITFSPNGSVVPTGTIQLTGPGGLTLSVTVDQAGRVQVN